MRRKDYDFSEPNGERWRNVALDRLKTIGDRNERINELTEEIYLLKDQIRTLKREAEGLEAKVFDMGRLRGLIYDQNGIKAFNTDHGEYSIAEVFKILDLWYQQSLPTGTPWDQSPVKGWQKAVGDVIQANPVSIDGRIDVRSMAIGYAKGDVQKAREIEKYLRGES